MIVTLIRSLTVRFLGVVALCLFWGSTLSAQNPLPETSDLSADTPIFKAYLNDPRFAEAWGAYTNRQFEQSYRLFSRLIRERPGDDGIDFAYALCARQCGKPSHAALAFERIIQRHPDNPRVRLELGRIYFEFKQYDLARDYFQSVLDANPPPDVRANIRQYLDRIDPDSSSRIQFAGRIGLGALHDDNVNVGPAAATIAISPIDLGGIPLDTLTVDEESKPLSVAGLSAVAGISSAWDFGTPHGWSTLGELDYYANWLDGADPYEIAVADAMAGLRYSNPHNLLTLPLQFRHIDQGDQSLANLSGVVPSWIWAPSPVWQSIAGGAVEYRDYAELNDRDAVLCSLGESVRRFFGSAHHSLSAGVTLFTEDADAAIYDNVGWAGSLSLDLRPTASTLLFVRGAYRDSRYAERETLAPEKRHDQQWQALTGLRQTLPAGWFIDAAWQFTDNDSTFDLYEYQRQIFTLSTTWTF